MTQEDIKALCRAGVLANEGELEAARGDAIDLAILRMAHALGIDSEDERAAWVECGRLPYESARKYAAAFCEPKEAQGQERGQVMAFVKGAPEVVREMCEDKGALKAQEADLAQEHYRILGMASGPVQGTKQEWGPDDLHGLQMAGLAAMRDPLRPEAKDSIEQCTTAGITVVMITGDQPTTAEAVAGALDIQGQATTGADLAKAQEEGPEALDRITRTSRVYARIEPRQKLDILESLQRQGHFVAMTGDGVNDAPALKHAHVGVAMGASGTDVARQSADIILSDDNFASIVAGVAEGRCAYNNIRKIVYFLACTSLAEVLVFLGAILVGMPIPFLATQLLWLNFVTSIIQDVAHAFGKPEGNEMKRPPRPPGQAIFNRLMLWRVGITGLTMSVIAFVQLHWFQAQGWTIEEIRNLLVLQFVLFENIIALNARSEDLSFFSQPLMHNPFLIYGVIAAQLLHIGAMYTPGLREILAIGPVGFAEWGVLVLCALGLMGVVELEKAARRRWWPAPQV